MEGRQPLVRPGGYLVLTEAQDTELKRVMSTIREVQKSADLVNSKFEPLQDTVALLKSTGVDVDEAKIDGHLVQDFLENAPGNFDSLVKKTQTDKESIMEMQMSSRGS